MGIFSIPTVKRNPTGILGLLLGIFLGGLGIIITGLVHDNAEEKKNLMIHGAIIFVVTLVTFGLAWVWGLIVGILLFVKSE